MENLKVSVNKRDRPGRISNPNRVDFHAGPNQTAKINDLTDVWGINRSAAMRAITAIAFRHPEEIVAYIKENY